MKEEKSESEECIKWSEDKLGYILSIYRPSMLLLPIPIVVINIILFSVIQYILKDWYYVGYYVGYYGLFATNLFVIKLQSLFIVWIILEMVNFAKKKDYMRVCTVSVFLCVMLTIISWLAFNQGGISNFIGAVKDFKYVYNNSYIEEIQTFSVVDVSKTPHTKGATTTSYDIVTTEMRFDLNYYADDKEFTKKFMRIDIHGKKIRVRYLPNSQLLLEGEIIY